MKKILQGKNIYILGGILIGVLFLTILLVIAIGRIYQRQIATFETKTPPQTVNLPKTAWIKKVTLKEENEAGCIEITPDGIVRIYDICGQDTSQAARASDLSNIYKLFKDISQTDFSGYQEGGEGQVYQLTIETDQGTKTIYITVNDQTPDQMQEIIEVIEEIKKDIAQILSSPTIYPAVSTPASSTLPLPTPWVSLPVVSPGSSPQPPGGGITTFICDFSESSTLSKPYRVSNFVCTTEPVVPVE